MLEGQLLENQRRKLCGEVYRWSVEYGWKNAVIIRFVARRYHEAITTADIGKMVNYAKRMHL